ncbi:MAG: rRNA pseudouridine synthase [Candidatus Magnetoovum sp. WYHC-5]|nr:rRNA pseudouridine synthase [Candidatus Magnetoovum sp. WYHC-5]
MNERIQKIISSLGIMSRRKVESLIAEGRITVNGTVAVLGTKADVNVDYIKLDGKLLNKTKERNIPNIYIKFYKPIEVVTTLDDPEERTSLAMFFKGLHERVYPVGRLDYLSEGLLLMTNDGNFANKVLHPSQEIPKVYRVKVKGIPEEKDLDKLRHGIRLEDGKTAPADIQRLPSASTTLNTWLDVTIHEGRKRQIRRMFTRINHPVSRLKRISIGSINLGALRPGQWQHLEAYELNKFYRDYLRKR